jgi:hypothetical protein
LEGQSLLRKLWPLFVVGAFQIAMMVWVLYFGCIERPDIGLCTPGIKIAAVVVIVCTLVVQASYLNARIPKE